jgi:hypothetical protein
MQRTSAICTVSASAMHAITRVEGQIWSIVFAHWSVKAQVRLHKRVHLIALESARGKMVGVQLLELTVDLS